MRESSAGAAAQSRDRRRAWPASAGALLAIVATSAWLLLRSPPLEPPSAAPADAPLAASVHAATVAATINRPNTIAAATNRPDTLAHGARSIVELPTIAAPTHGTVMGRVADTNGLPVTGLRMLADRAGTGAAAIATAVDDHGRFAFVSLPCGIWTLWVDRDSMRSGLVTTADGARRSIAVRQEQVIAGVFVVARAATLTGNVLTADGAPIRSAQVRARGDTQMTQQAITDELGRYRFAGLRPGRYRLTVSLEHTAPSLAALTLPQALEFDLADGKVTTALPLVCGAGTALVRGHVVDELGRPVPALLVECLDPEATSCPELASEQSFVRARTDADGTFELNGVPAGAVVLRLGFGDHCAGTNLTVLQPAPAPLPLWPRPGATHDVGRLQVTLQRPYRLTGCIATQHHGTDARPRVLIAVIDADSPTARRVHFHSNRSFLWHCATPRGPILVRVESADGKSVSQTLLVRPHPDARDALTFHLE